MRAIAAVARADTRNIARDPLLILLAGAPLLAALIVRLGFRPLADALAPGFDLLPWAPVFTAMLVIITPLLLGFVIGFMLLEERDEGLLAAVAVTPAGRRGFLLARLALPALWCIPATLLVATIAGTPAVAPFPFLAIAGLAALEAPILPLFMAAFAANRLEGMALAKVGSLAIGLALVAVIVPPPWQWLAAPLPHFWPVRLIVEPPHGMGWILPLVVAAAVHAGALALLGRLFARRTEA